MGSAKGIFAAGAVVVLTASAILQPVLSWRTFDAVKNQEKALRFDPTSPTRDYMNVPVAVTYRGVEIGLVIFRGASDQSTAELTQQVLNAIDAMQGQVAAHEKRRAETGK